MPTIEHALVTIPFEPRQLDGLAAALKPARVTVVTDRRDRAAIARALETADVAFVRGHVDALLLDARRLRWIHSDHAGLDRSVTPALFRSELTLTGSAGRSASALAEQALMFMTALNFGYPRLYAAQRARNWREARRIIQRSRPLCESTLGILGVGHTGRALASRAKALGMRVEGYRRRRESPPEAFDRVYSRDAGDALDLLLRAADHLVVAASLNDTSTGLLGRRQLALMKPGAFVINVARGALVDEQALVEALDRGAIAGAGLDVFASEPLPTHSPLWRHPGVLLTPHARPTQSDRGERVVQQILENIERYRAGAPLRNQVSKDDVYSGECADRPRSNAPRPTSALAGVSGRTRTLSKRMIAALARSRRRRYPLRPVERARQDVVRHPVADIAWIDTFCKRPERETILSMSLFVLDHEVLRFDCTGTETAHFHVADDAGFHRILLGERGRQAQIDRALFEIANNTSYYLRRNPRRSVRAASLDPEALARACAGARRTLAAHAAWSA